MDHPTLNARYSVSEMSWRFLLWLCCSLFFYYLDRQAKSDDIRLHLIVAGFLCASIVDFYYLLFAKKRMIMLIDAAGFKDSRISATVIPWNAVKSMRPYLRIKDKRKIGITVEIDPLFWRTLSLRPSFKFLRFVNMESGTSINLETDTLDASWSEVLRVAGAYTLIKTHDWMDGVINEPG